MEKISFRLNNWHLILIALFTFESAFAQGGIEFDTKKWNFGENYIYSEVYNTFKFVNTSNSTLIIDTIEVSDRSVMTVSYPRNPIPPQGSGTVDVKCNYSGKFLGHTRKTLKIVTKPDNKIIRLYIEGDLTDDAPQRCKRVDSSGFVWYQIFNNKKFGAEDASGKILLPTEFDNISFEKDVFKVMKEEKKGIYSKLGKCIIPVNYNSVYIWNNGYFIAKNGYEGFCDLNGNNIISLDRQYKELTQSSDNAMGTYFKFSKGKQFGLCNITGKEVWSKNISDTYIEALDGKSVSVNKFEPIFKLGKFCLLVKAEGMSVCLILDGNGNLVMDKNKNMIKCLSFKIGDDGMIYGTTINRNSTSLFEEISFGRIDKYVSTTNNPLQGNPHK